MPLVKIKRELEKRNVRCLLTHSSNTLEHSILFKPDAIVLGNPDLYHGENATLLSNKAVIFSIPTEQGILEARYFADRMIGGHNKNNTDFEPPNIDVVNKFFLWAEYQKETLLTAGIPLEKLFVSGNARLSIPGNRDFENCRDSKIVGVALETEIVASLSYALWALDGLDNAYGSYLDYYTLDVNILHAQLKAIKLLSGEGYKVIVRPRTIDRNTDYSFFGDSIEIDLSLDPSYLLNKCNFIVTGQSTIGLEAYLYGAKVISVLGMLKPHLVTDVMKNYLSFQHPTQPQTMEDLLRLVGDPSQYKPSEDFLGKIRYYFGSHMSNPETTIANEIIRVLQMTPLPLVDQTKNEAAFRIAQKFTGLRSLVIKHRENVFGAMLVVIILAKRLILNGFKYYDKN